MMLKFSRPLLAVSLALAVQGVAADGAQGGHGAGSDLPNIGDSSGTLISPLQERELGRAFMRSVRQQARLVEDPDIAGYVSQLGQQLVGSSDTPTYPFTFFVVDNPTINAFAGPGGYIGVHTGLLTAAENESELAGVMAHEIAHVSQRHLYRAYEAANRMSLPTAAAMIAAVLLGVATNSDAGIAAVSAIQAGSLQYQINFTRANEKEADRIGIQTLARAGIDPFGMPGFFERLQASTRLYGAGLPEFLSTHPVTTNRLAESLQRAEQYGRHGRRDSLTFQLVRAKLTVLASRDPQQTLRQYAEQAKVADPPPQILYGYALALEKAGKPDAARTLLLGLLEKDPDRIIYRTTLGRLDVEQGRTEQGLARLADTLKLYPRDLTVSQYYAAALLRAGRPEQARALISDLLRDGRDRSPALYQLLAKAADASGRPWETHSATAEIYALNGQTHAAIGQLEKALGFRQLDYYERARLEARLQQLKQEAAEEEEDGH